MGVGTFKDKEGRTRYRVTFSRDGRRLVDERLPPGTTREQADQYYAKITRDWFDRERLGVSEVPLISAVIREYEQRIIPHLKAKRFARDCIKVVGPHVIGHRMDELPEVADEVAKAIRHQKPASIAHRVRFLRTMARYAVKWRLVKIDYGACLQAPVVRNERQYYVDRHILANILKTASKQARRACWQLFYSGMRRSELYAANIRGEAYYLADTKNGSPRIVPIPLPVKRIASIPTMTPDGLSKAFMRAASKAGYQELHLHDLRHSAASMWLNSGIELPLVGMMLGHTDSKSTRRYSHLATATMRRAMDFAATDRKAISNQRIPAGTAASGKLKKVA